MEKILKKLFYKWFVHEITNFQCVGDVKTLMDDLEKKDYNETLNDDIYGRIHEIINQVQGLLDDASSDIEFDMMNKLDQLREDDWDADDGWKVDEPDLEEPDIVEETPVICGSIETCEAPEIYPCSHKKPHFKGIDCGAYCKYKKNLDDDCVPCKETPIKQDNRFNKVVICMESKDCDFKDCEHIKPHIFNASCIGDCVNKGEHRMMECI